MSDPRSWQYGILQDWHFVFFAGLIAGLFGSAVGSRLVAGIGYSMVLVGVFRFGYLIWMASKLKPFDAKRAADNNSSPESAGCDGDDTPRP